MKVIKAGKEGKRFGITLLLETKSLDTAGSITPEVDMINVIYFKDKKEAQSFYQSIVDNNNMALADNQARLIQMPTNSLELVNDFAAAITKSGALSKRNSQKIEDLIAAHDNMRTFQRNLEDIAKKNGEVVDILDAINKSQ